MSEEKKVKFIEDYENVPVIVTPNNATELKLTLDDALKKLLNEEYRFKENFRHIDSKLFFGYSACAFAVFASIHSFMIPFPDCKPILLLCVIGYFLMNGAMMAYITFVEKNIIYVGLKKDPLGIDADKKVAVSADIKRETGDYTISYELTGLKKPVKNTKTYSVGEFFDVEGQFAPDVFYSTLTKLFGEDKLKLE